MLYGYLVVRHYILYYFLTIFTSIEGVSSCQYYYSISWGRRHKFKVLDTIGQVNSASGESNLCLLKITGTFSAAVLIVCPFCICSYTLFTSIDSFSWIEKASIRSLKRSMKASFFFLSTSFRFDFFLKLSILVYL